MVYIRCVNVCMCVYYVISGTRALNSQYIPGTGTGKKTPPVPIDTGTYMNSNV